MAVAVPFQCKFEREVKKMNVNELTLKYCLDRIVPRTAMEKNLRSLRLAQEMLAQGKNKNAARFMKYNEKLASSGALGGQENVKKKKAKTKISVTSSDLKNQSNVSLSHSREKVRNAIEDAVNKVGIEKFTPSMVLQALSSLPISAVDYGRFSKAAVKHDRIEANGKDSMGNARNLYIYFKPLD